MLVLVVHVDAHGLHCYLRLCWCLWSMLLLETMLICDQGVLRSKIRAAGGCYGQGSFFCSGLDDCRLIIEYERY